MQYRIGDLMVQMNCAEVYGKRGTFMDQFRHEGEWGGEILELSSTTEPLKPWLTDKLLGDNGVYEIYRHDEELLLSYHWGNQYHGFIVRPDRFSVIFSPKMVAQPPIPDDWFFSVCGFHRQLLKRNACVLHSSYIDAGGKAILFSAPSGTGKSTQAALWERHTGAAIINGDRAVLRKRAGQWHTFGYPCCGSSRISLNRTLPLGAIVILEQGDVTRIEQMSAGQKIRALATAMEFYPWDQTEMNLVFDLALKITAEVPVVRLICRADEDAVLVLKNYLTEEGII